MDSTFGPLRRRRIVYSVLTVFILLNFFYLLRLMINGPTIEGDILLDPKLNPNILVDDSSRSLGQQLAAPDQRPLLPGPNVER
ncbi:unnamed protein product [Protopolystoma xenopodis]|uniref:Uncharacterized protein n=1 Tax=Protopolystoma xenopodis TaxID=117903 RepID=A0A448XBJ9_9PLAT|nr:unnamed protein product [Protopolystoma xenopodis]